MSNGCAGERKRTKFLPRLRGFITAAARNYYCSGLITRKCGKQLASGATPSYRSICCRDSHRAAVHSAASVAEAGFSRRNRRLDRSGQFLGRRYRSLPGVDPTLPCSLDADAGRVLCEPARRCGRLITANLPSDLPNLQAVHLELQRAERNAQRPSGRRYVPPSFFEGPNDEVALER